jgi:hypothetical protein
VTPAASGRPSPALPTTWRRFLNFRPKFMDKNKTVNFKFLQIGFVGLFMPTEIGV